ncbi:MAG: AAA family ATPase [Clostridiales Family XIII bacterium]|nr:AAA family ATPase [Clostridiales Family XIII bacterium]
MEMYHNPFTPVFGNEPPVFAGRDEYIRNVLKGLDNAPGDPNRITIFTGPRGSGKTVLLAKIASEAEKSGWIHVHTPAVPDMLTDIVEQTERKAAEHIPKKSKSKLTGLQIYGTGFTRETEPEKQGTWRSQMDRLLDILEEKGIGLIFTIDEVSPELREMVSFISTFQVFIMEKRNVALLMAGLPGNVMQLIRNDRISFLRRAFRRELGPLSMPDVRTAMKRTIAITGRTIERQALEYAAEKTDGLPFLIQLVGYHTFNQSDNKKISLDDAATGVTDAYEDMRNMIFDATLAELSATDKDFLRAMTYDDGPSRISDIAKRMNVSASQASHYKKRLIKQGVIAERGRGLVEFAMPMLKSLLSE